MAAFSLRRVTFRVAPALVAALIAIPTIAKAGTDVFGGGIGSHATSMYAGSYDTPDWGITGMRPLTPSAPEPALSVVPSKGDFGPLPGSDYLGANGYGSPLDAGVSSGNLGGTLQPLSGGPYSR
jgi:hypothetical protein